MEKLTSVVVIFFGVLAVVFLQCVTAQTVHVVGDSIGWTVPTGGASAYQTWAASKQFVVGDILSFNFITNAHDVLQVPKESYDSCSSSNPIGDTITTGPVNITLSTAGTHYYICTLGRHCLSGQKLSVTISSSPSGVPPTSMSTPPSTPTTPATPSPTSGTPVDCAPTPASSPTPTPGTMSPPDSSSSGVFANLFISLLSIAMGFLF
ncbi:cucumber peeling cupredoxin-like [Juglans regia]|uniref:Cucumber peeling cupredoxin-like n=1 Tax=Juglans regia TaxID=51240 RepID=A0A2I4FFI2_JUGRE|nr:cucumber peeling cupredoxin-like [Juglans regia]